jgi:hypothetical protein
MARRFQLASARRGHLSPRSGPRREAKRELKPPRSSHQKNAGKSAMDEIEAFLDECRADPWFQSHPEVVDRLESVLTELYLDGEGPEWEAIWYQACTVCRFRLKSPIVPR